MLRTIAARAGVWLRGPRALPAPPPARPLPEGAFVAFVVPVESSTQVNQTDHYSTVIASMRLRAIIPARQLAKRVPVWFVALDDYVRDPGLSTLGRVGAVVISKLPAPNILQRQAALSELLARAAADRGEVPLFADMPDDLAALGRVVREPYLARYQNGLGASCTFIVPSRTLGEGLVRDARRGITIVEDPYENRAQEVRATVSSPLRLMWFGNLGDINEPMLTEALASALAPFRDHAFRFEVVTRKGAVKNVEAIRKSLFVVHPGCEFRFTEWSLHATDEALARCDFVLIPQDHRTDWGKGKSHNRLVTAIRGGRLAIASPIPAYQELSDYAWVGEDLAAGLRWALEHPQDAVTRVRAGQRYVEERFSPESVGRKWAAALGIG
jgi:hypothetical protein